MLVFLFLLVISCNGDGDIDWAFMGTKYSTLNKRGEFVESKINEKQVLEYVQRNSQLDIADALAENFKKTPILEFRGTDKAYVDDVVGDTTCPYQIRAVSRIYHDFHLISI